MQSQENQRLQLSVPSFMLEHTGADHCLYGSYFGRNYPSVSEGTVAEW